MNDSGNPSIVCPNCGTPIPDGELLCPNCSPISRTNQEMADRSESAVASSEAFVPMGDATDPGYGIDFLQAEATPDANETFTFEDIDFGPSNSELDQAFAPKDSMFARFTAPAAAGAAGAAGVAVPAGAQEAEALVSDGSIETLSEFPLENAERWTLGDASFDISTQSGDFTETFDPSTLGGGTANNAGAAAVNVAKIVPVPIGADSAQQALEAVIDAVTPDAMAANVSQAANAGGSAGAAGAGSATGAPASPILEAVGNAPSPDLMHVVAKAAGDTAAAATPSSGAVAATGASTGAAATSGTSAAATAGTTAAATSGAGTAATAGTTVAATSGAGTAATAGAGMAATSGAGAATAAGAGAATTSGASMAAPRQQPSPPQQPPWESPGSNGSSPW